MPSANEFERNYANLKAQCAYKLAERVNKREISALGCKITTDIEGMDEERVKEFIVEDMEQIKERDPDKDKKRALVPKEKVKEAIGRSPDFGDNMIMRMVFEFRESDDGGFTSSYPTHEDPPARAGEKVEAGMGSSIPRW